MSLAQEMFARLWYVGLALSPVLLLACCYLRSRGTAGQRHGVGVAVLLALLISSCLPVLREPGALLSSARQNFKSAGLAPCKAPRMDAPPSCLTFTYSTPWSFGCFLLLGWYGLSFLATSHLRRRAHGPAASTRLEVRAAAAQLGMDSPRLGMLPGSYSPMVVGVVQPMLLLPAGLWEELDSNSREAILRHELAHLRRRDLLVQQVSSAVRALFWWHPLVWWLRAEIARVAERAADAIAIGGSAGRAEALARGLLAIESCERPALVPLNGALALSPAARDLKQRLNAMFEVRSAPRYSRLLATLAFTAALSAGWASVQIALG